MRERKQYILLVILLLLATLLVSFLIPERIEQPPHPPMVTVTYIIPDDFSGVVVVRFGSADPKLVVFNGNIDVTFSADGWPVLSFAMPGWPHGIRARYAGGKSIPCPVDNPTPDTVALYPVSTFGDVHGPINTEVFVIGTESQFKQVAERDHWWDITGPFN